MINENAEAINENAEAINENEVAINKIEEAIYINAFKKIYLEVLINTTAITINRFEEQNY